MKANVTAPSFVSFHPYSSSSTLSIFVSGKDNRNIDAHTNVAQSKFIRWTKPGRTAYQSQISIMGPVGYGPTILPPCHSDFLVDFATPRYISQLFS